MSFLNTFRDKVLGHAGEAPAAPPPETEQAAVAEPAATADLEPIRTLVPGAPPITLHTYYETFKAYYPR